MPTPKLTLTTEVMYLKGVGPARAGILASHAIHTVEDLLYYTPFRYEDRTRITPIRELVAGQTTTILGRVLTGGLTRTRGGMYIYDLSAADASSPQARGMIRCKWFNAAYLEKNKVFRPGQRVFFYGKAEIDRYGAGNLQIIQPQYEILPEGESAAAGSLEVGRVVPIYESMGTLTPRVLRRLMWTALESLAGQIADRLPPSVRARNKLLDRAAALRGTHFPDPQESVEALASLRTAAQTRLIFEEFFNVLTGLALKRRRAKETPGIQFHVTSGLREKIKRILPFHPTAAQKRVLKEIADDMCSPRPMSRLLQGDVGSGKTIVAIQAALLAIESGYQVAFMAPTEILATQHFLYMRQLLQPLPPRPDGVSGCRVDLLISARKPGEKSDIKKRMADGTLDLVVGTHALIEEDVELARLGLVVVDEQHRFGVMQRYRLIRKGRPPDVLVMTATPIPRTLALTLYGDLDVSVIDELPPHRTPIQTRVLGENDRQKVFNFIREKVRRGGQAYVVYPLIEESEQLDLRPAVRMHEQLSRNVFPEFRMALLHGRLPSPEKELVMQAFKRGEVQILVSTTVIEVGVDVPNATVMLIEHAERFGLAQLHQLRGRIGRGTGKSYCLLLAGEPRTETADERLRALVQTADGFRLAELDLRIRGPGEFFGTRQWGIPAFRIGNLVRDRDILEWARREAQEFVDHAPDPAELGDFANYLRSIWP